jgi:uncharacterized protein YceK
MGPIIIVVVVIIIIIIITTIIIILCGCGSFSDHWTNETTDYLYFEAGNCKMMLKRDRIEALNNLQFLRLFFRLHS